VSPADNLGPATEVRIYRHAADGALVAVLVGLMQNLFYKINSCTYITNVQCILCWEWTRQIDKTAYYSIMAFALSKTIVKVCSETRNRSQRDGYYYYILTRCLRNEYDIKITV